LLSNSFLSKHSPIFICRSKWVVGEAKKRVCFSFKTSFSLF
jgi:hypothetical protein